MVAAMAATSLIVSISTGDGQLLAAELHVLLPAWLAGAYRLTIRSC